MGNELEKQAAIRHDFSFKRDENLIGCMSHIINLACQELIVKGLKSVAPPDGSTLQIMMKEVSMQLLLDDME